jgi:hypothetical protein
MNDVDILSPEDRHDELRGRAIEDATQRFYRCGGLWAGSELLTWVTAYDMAFNSDAYSAWQKEFSAAEDASPRDWRTIDRLAFDHQMILQGCLRDAITEIATQAVENTTEIEGD